MAALSDPDSPALPAFHEHIHDAAIASVERRAAVELEERVAQRTRELAAANAALEAEIALRRRVEAELRRLLETTPGVAYTCTPTLPFRLTSMTGNAERLLGVSASELMGNAEVWARRVHPEDLERVVRAAARVLTDGSAMNEYRYRHTDGSYHWICDSASMIRAEDGSPIEVVGYWLDVTQSRLDQQARQERERLRAVTEALIAAQEAERRRIARELHDGINQRLAVLILDIAEVERKPGPATRLGRRFAALRATAGDITDDVRRLAIQLHPVRLEQMGLEEALRHECASITERAGIAVCFACEGLPELLDPAIALCLYRVAQESLQNMVRHSRSRDGGMRLESCAGGLRLTVTDSGDGFDPAIAGPSTGFGIFSMRERVHLLEGSFSLDSAPGRGTRIEVWLPLAREAK
ncbi:MAG TPA: PAS domain-containing protein [Bryobacteraceae bacterium]|nr:PAS domain-containing protein [Bryobacteraceae bacterium]